MFRSMMITGLLLAAVVFMSACGEGDPSFSLLADTEVFYQNKNETNTKIDILWVIDNSGSMRNSQDNLIAEFEAFIDGFRNRGLDFKMAVTTTDAFVADYAGNTDAYNYMKSNPSIPALADFPLMAQFRDETGDGHFVVTPDTVDFENIFLTNVNQGTAGYGDERAFQSFRAALNSDLNSGFLREDSFLAIIIVSDEEDFSIDINQPSSWVFNNSYDNPKLDAVQTYVDFLDTLTNSNSHYKRYSVSAMAIFDDECQEHLNTTDPWPGRKIALRYAELVELTGGEKGSLCDNFSESLDIVSEGIIQLATQFYLSRLPVPDTIVVKINGSEVPKVADPENPQNGWLYNAENNSIVFYGTAIPEQGAAIDVNFDPVSVGL